MNTVAIRPSLDSRTRLLALLELWTRVAETRWLAYLVFLAVYLPPTVILAENKLLWDDEFFTLYLSKAGSWSELVRAMSTGADQHPPSFYYLTHLVTSVLGPTNVTFRLLSISGFALLCFCLYEIAGRMLNRQWGFCAMLLALACPHSWYAVEARGYALQLGFVGLTFLAWMLAAAREHRRMTLPLLAMALCGAVGSHYYAAAILFPLTVGELARTIVNRRLDWPVWLAFAGALVPVAAFAPLIVRARSYSGHFWAIPKWSYMVSWYPDALGYVVAVPLGVAALVAVRRATRPPAAVAPERHLAPWHAAAFLALAFLPVELVLTAKTVTHAFHARYAIAAFPGVCVLLILGLARMSGYSPRFAAAIWVMLLACFGGMSYRYQTVLRTERSDLQDTARFLRDHGEGPVAVSHLTRFHRLSFYAPRRLAGRLVYLADPSAAVKYLGWDTVDRGLLALNEWFPLNVRWFHEWVSGQRSFLVLGPVSDWSWLPTAFARSDADVKLVGTSGENLLLSVKDVKLPPDSRLPGDPSGYPMLFSRMPAEGRPLCEQYFPAGSCPNMD